MRRRRHALQVSTFPFLAVLLCTMGSLILILLVIDRRAKVVARAKAEAERADLIASARMANRKRQEEWERRRQALHGLLAREVEQVHDQAKTAKEKVETTAQLTRAELERLEELRRKLEAERSSLLMGESGLKTRKAKIEKETKETGARQADLARMAANLDVLERTLADLKAARQRQSQTYSLVPYRGKHGDNRRPIYLECTGNGLVFHPDRYTLGFPLNLLDIRAEVQRRIQLLGTMQTTNNGEQKPTYLLVLLRPSGITNYYRTLASMVGLNVEFGYEMVDEDWVLDFSEDEKSRTPQPWMLAGNAAPPRSPPLKPPPGVPIQRPGPLIINGSSVEGPRQASGDIRRAGGPVILNGNGYSGPPGTTGGPWRSPAGNPRGVAAGIPGGLGGPYAAGGGPGSGAIPGIPGGTGPAPAGGGIGGPPGSATGIGTQGSGMPGSAGGGTGTGKGGVPGGRGTLPGYGVAGGNSPSGNGGPGTRGNSVVPGQPGQGGNGRGTGNGGNGARVLASAGGGTSTGYAGNGLSGGGSGNSNGNSRGNGNSPGNDRSPKNSNSSGNGTGTASTGRPAQSGNASGNTGTKPVSGGPRGSGGGTGSEGPASGSSRSGSSSTGGGSASGGGSSGTGGGSSGSGGTPGGGGSAAGGSPGASGMEGISLGSFGPATTSSAGQGSPPTDSSSSSAPSTINLSNAQKPPSNGSAGGPPPNTMNTGPGANPHSDPSGAKPRADGVMSGRSSSSGGSGGDMEGGGLGMGSSLPGAATQSAQTYTRPPRLLSNRDWPIVLECRDDAVVLPFGNQRIPTESLTGAYGQNSPLYQVVKQLIDRRQASVRSGESPFRPSIRFRVHPDGLRTYYFAYPALESLRLPMTRENVYPELERR